VTPVTGPKPMHRCVPRNGQTCVVDAKPTWTASTVPSLNDGSSTVISGSHAAGSSWSHGSHSGSASDALSALSSSSPSGLPAQELSSNPQIAAAQQAFYAKTQEVVQEKQWVAQVKQIIHEYQHKIKNVQKHTHLTEAELRKSRKSIVAMIKAEKQAKLEQELKAALDSLKKLETTSQHLTGKMSELTHTKLGLRAVIAKIQHAVHLKPNSPTFVALQEVIKPSPLELSVVQEQANRGAKDLFGSLLQLVNEVHANHLEHERQHELEDKKTVKATAQEDNDEGETNDLQDVSDRVAQIAAKYADEENDRLHAKLSLRGLSAKEYEIDEDDTLA